MTLTFFNVFFFFRSITPNIRKRIAKAADIAVGIGPQIPVSVMYISKSSCSYFSDPIASIRHQPKNEINIKRTSPNAMQAKPFGQFPCLKDFTVTMMSPIKSIVVETKNTETMIRSSTGEPVMATIFIILLVK
jgi:hypothetical protein